VLRFLAEGCFGKTLDSWPILPIREVRLDVSFDRAVAAETSGARSLSAPLVFSTFVAGLGGLLFGFDTAVISGTTDALTREYGLNGATLGFTVASALIGTIIGSLLVSRPADVWGRRAVLAVLAVFYLVSALGCAWAWDWGSLVAFRILGGLGVGGASVVSPMYIAEIAPARYRGRLVAIVQFNIVFGILLAFFSNYVIARVIGADAWRWMFGVEAAPAALFLLFVFFVPDSPRWLVARGRVEEAAKTLRSLGSDQDVETEIRGIQESLEPTHPGGEDRFFQWSHRRPIMLAVTIALFNQLSGINAVLYYAPVVFKMAGAGEDSALLQAVAIGATNLVFTMLAMTIIDRAGRRRLMILGSIGYILSLGATAWAFYTYGTEFTATGSVVVLVSLLVFIASHAFGQGAVIWVFISEIFPNRARARGQALGSFTHWVGALAISQTFPMIAERSGGHAFAFYAGMMVLQLLWVLFLMPETKGVPLEEIQKELSAA